MITAELHCHTNYSKDSLMRVEQMLAICTRKRIDRIAVTDHNTITGAKIAKDYNPRLVLIGEEIMTAEGEILALFVKEKVPSGLSPEETIHILRGQGAFIGVAHPFDRFRHGRWKEDALERILPLIDGLEVYNARCIYNKDNRKAQEFADKWKINTLVGSDAHTAMEIGKATLVLPDFNDTESLKHALKEATIHTHHSPAWIHLASRYATWHKKFIKL
jgi:predicted metal-dependent phosphoesterase TrpH